MAKKKDSHDNLEGTEHPQDSEPSRGSQNNGEEPKRPGGRTTARWKQFVFQQLPAGSDQEIADRLNEIAHEEGYDYHCSPQAVARWREAEAASQAAPVAEEGIAYAVLRDLMRLLGKEGLKKFIDSL
jgi:hypothetical protein